MKTPIFPNPQAKGFALVVTISLLVLLSVIALGFLSLSAVTLRSGSHEQAQMEAHANARMALAIAIGELQKHTGADTRITAPADIVESNAPRITGVWRSWEGLNHEKTGTAAGRPKQPAYGIKTQPYDPDDEENGRFLTWLISGAIEGENINNPSALAFPAAAADGSTVALLAEGTLGTNPGQIHVAPRYVNDNTGAIAWWVSPENQKARLLQPHYPRTDDVVGWVENGQSHSIPNPGVFGLDSLRDDPETFIPDPNAPKTAQKAISLKSTELLINNNPEKPQQSFHDLSTSSIGLLTNTATGGWRKDLSLLTEKWDSIYSGYSGGKLPLFRLSQDAGDTTLVPKPVKPAASVAVTNTTALAAATPAQSNLYPWNKYSTILGYTQPGTYHAASASWASLQSFATSYKNFSSSSGSLKSPFVWDKIAKQTANNVKALEIYNHKNRQNLHLQIARVQVLVYVRAVERTPVTDPKRFNMQMLYVPLFTLWNPYNITLEHTISGTLNAGQGSGKEKNFLGFGWRRSLPGALAIANKATYPNPDLIPITQYRMLSEGNFQTLDWPSNYANLKDFQAGINPKYGERRWRQVASDTWGCWLPEGTLTFKPGEAKIFSPEWQDNGYGFGGGTFRLREGYDPTNIVGTLATSNVPTNLLGGANYWFIFRNDRLTQPYRSRVPGYGFSVSFGDGGSHFGGTAVLPSGIGDEFHNITALSNEGEGDKYWPPDEIDEVGYSVAELASGPWIPVYSMNFGPRMTIGTPSGTVQNRPTKGVVQNNALAGMVLSDPASGASKDHPVNNTYDFAYHSLSIGSTITPNLSNSAAYIATGHQSGDGLSRLIAVEVPLRPMASLVELMGWNPRGQNPYPPFQMNLIGNSDATPLIPSDSVVPPVLEPSNNEFNLQHDDAYCANHLLFDDWFVSSIAPQSNYLGGDDITKDIETFYSDFLQGQDELSNRSYQPIPDDSGLTVAQSLERVQEIINSPDGWLKVGSRFEVDGMFNINSTSVAAWKALLGHAKNREKIALHGADGIESTTASTGHAVTNGAVASDVEAGSGPAFGGQFDNASEFTGFRSLTDDQIEDLAEKIVEQVRLRGPFLSLAEFVNRQLGNDENMALAGAVQTAINNLDDDPMDILRNPDNSLSDTTMLESDEKLDGADYAFSKAAEGSSAYGAPGWIRQADILRPIAPILSARDDTFTIRAYGDARDGKGNITARAWCEAVVKRTRDFCDESDPADSIDAPTSAINTTFGRRYVIMSFRWLGQDEI